jgi:hypothetical protein
MLIGKGFHLTPHDSALATYGNVVKINFLLLPKVVNAPPFGVSKKNFTDVHDPFAELHNKITLQNGKE